MRAHIPYIVVHTSLERNQILNRKCNITSQCWNKWRSSSPDKIFNICIHAWRRDVRTLIIRPNADPPSIYRAIARVCSHVISTLRLSIPISQSRNSFILRNNHYIQCDIFTRHMMLSIRDIRLLNVIRWYLYSVESIRRRGTDIVCEIVI